LLIRLQMNGMNLGVHKLGGQQGSAMLEVLIGGTVQAIALVGLALMFATGQSMIVAEGSQRVELYLAEQKLEGTRALGFAGAGTGSQTETLTAGQGAAESFTRVTCIYYVSDSTLGEPPASGCTVGSATSTKRVRVTVTPSTYQADAVTLETVLVNGS
jgi:Tfp pilus assembly protein PilV